MENRNELIESIDIAAKGGRKLIAEARDFISIMEVLITAALSLKAILEKNDGGEVSE